MKTGQLIALSALLAGLLAGCGGGGGSSASGGPAPGGGGATPDAPAQPSTPAAPGSGTDAGAGDANASPRVTTVSWTNVKFGGGGYVPGLVFHPTNSSVLYARTDIGGAYRWDAASSGWVAITDGMGPTEGFYHGTETMAVDPNDDRRVYMSAGMYLSAKPDARLYISTDRGDNWTWVSLPFSAGSNNQGRAVGERLMVDPNQSSILFYGSRASGLWKSTDYGKTWAQVQSLSSHKMTQAEIDAVFWQGVVGVEQVIFDTSTKGTGTPTQTIYTAVAPDYAKVAGLTHSLYKSVNGGASWTPVATPVTDYYIPHMVRAKDGMMYVAFTQGTGPGAAGSARLYKFDGTNWTLLKSYDNTQWTSFGMGGLSVHGSGASTRIALGVTNSWGNWEGQPVVQLSDDAGATWREIGSMTPHTPSTVDFSGWVDDIEIDPNNPERILHVFGGGVWETKNASAAKPTWTYAVNGIEETATLALMTPAPGASYSLLNSSGDVGVHVHTDLASPPTRGPRGTFGNGLSADMAWSSPSYIAAIGTSAWSTPNVGGVYSTDSGVTWTPFPANHPNGLANQSNESNLAVLKPGHIIWAPANSVPAVTTDHGATWVMTNLPALTSTNIPRSYRVAADRKNPNRVYAFDSGGAWWGPQPKFYASNDGGRTFTQSASFGTLGARSSDYHTTSMAVNPYAEGHVWVTDGGSMYHSTDAGVTWKKLTVTASIYPSAEPNRQYPEVYGATSIALGKPDPKGKYSAAVYVVGVIGGVWGVHRSDDAGLTWRRYNDDKHQFGGIGTLAADHNVVGRLYLSGGGRGIFYSH